MNSKNQNFGSRPPTSNTTRYKTLNLVRGRKPRPATRPKHITPEIPLSKLRFLAHPSQRSRVSLIPSPRFYLPRKLQIATSSGQRKRHPQHSAKSTKENQKSQRLAKINHTKVMNIRHHRTQEHPNSAAHILCGHILQGREHRIRALPIPVRVECKETTLAHGERECPTTRCQRHPLSQRPPHHALPVRLQARPHVPTQPPSWVSGQQTSHRLRSGPFPC